MYNQSNEKRNKQNAKNKLNFYKSFNSNYLFLQFVKPFKVNTCNDKIEEVAFFFFFFFNSFPFLLSLPLNWLDIK